MHASAMMSCRLWIFKYGIYLRIIRHKNRNDEENVGARYDDKKSFIDREIILYFPEFSLYRLVKKLAPCNFDDPLAT